MKICLLVPSGKCIYFVNKITNIIDNELTMKQVALSFGHQDVNLGSEINSFQNWLKSGNLNIRGLIVDE